MTFSLVNPLTGGKIVWVKLSSRLLRSTNSKIESTDLSERDTASVHLGDTVNISLEALNTHLSGKVVSISPIADSVGDNIVFKVTVALDEQPEGLLWGTIVEVTIGE